MINYVMLGTNDLERSIAFYDDLLKELGATRAYHNDAMAAWSFGNGATMLCVTKPFDEQPATVGNGVMVALGVTNPETVDRLHAKALASGATDEGSPGSRGAASYAGYFRDPDGNKLNFIAACELT
jgi:catechol 2,3-dioxygenase-like lactoylglutathione lyase family enzyme